MNRVKYIPLIIVIVTLFHACASIGRPDGGPRDVTPPEFVSSSPSPGQLNVTDGRISVVFNENIMLDDPGSKITVSPTQSQQPKILSNGRKVSIALPDSLVPNTTYTIDFSDAVKDLNEGNVLDGFALDFSTGSTRDSLMVSGMVLEAKNLEPAQGILVGAYLSSADTLIASTPFDRVTRTNHLGQFTLRNLPDTAIQLFALKDINRDLHWDRTEDIAFHGTMIRPTVSTVALMDTLRSSLGEDSIVQRKVSEYLPNDILLTWFNEDYKPQYLKNYARSERNILSLEMNCKADTLPSLQIVAIGSRQVSIPMADVAYTAHSEGRDSIVYYLTDSVAANADSLLIATRYLRTDSTSQVTWHTDTLKFNHRLPKGHQPNVTMTFQQKIDSILAISDTIPIDTFALLQPDKMLGLSLGTTLQDVDKPLLLNATTPVKSIDFSGVRLQYNPDSVWSDVSDAPRLTTLNHWGKTYVLDYPWASDSKYRLEIDSMAAVDIFGNYNANLKLEFKTRPLSDYSSIRFDVVNAPDSVASFVTLLNEKDTPVRTLPVCDDGSVTFEYLMPSTYYARLFVDTTPDSVWTNGNLLELQQPEDVYYLPKKLRLKKNWDMRETWDILALPPDQQKPLDIKANKPRKAKDEKEEEDDDEEEEDDSFI